MSEQSAARRMRLLEELAQTRGGKELGSYAKDFNVDERTIRRDVDFLQDILSGVRQVSLNRGKVHATQGGHGFGYFHDQVDQNLEAKRAIACAVVDSLEDNMAVALTAGSTTYYVARQIRRAFVEDERPRNLIAFTNSLPALHELIAGGISTGVLGEVYNSDDSAFHSHEFRSAFQPSLAIVGASGVVANAAGGTLDLFSHRAEEASFLKQLLAPIPEIVVAVDGTKLGHRHPWSYTSGGILAGKTVRLVSAGVPEAQRDILEALTSTARKSGFDFQYHEAMEPK